MALTSIDYARLVQFTALKLHMALLNKTQVNKILFYIYGAYMADTGGKVLFSDDTPKAWTYGPVFPIPNKRVVACEKIKQDYFSPEKIEEFRKDQVALKLVTKVVANMYDRSAISLTEWSHLPGSPWYNTIYQLDESGKVVGQNPWNTPIAPKLIEEYFKNKENRIFG